jgi:hypothetical protein
LLKGVESSRVWGDELDLYDAGYGEGGGGIAVNSVLNFWVIKSRGFLDYVSQCRLRRKTSSRVVVCHGTCKNYVQCIYMEWKSQVVAVVSVMTFVASNTYVTVSNWEGRGRKQWDCRGGSEANYNGRQCASSINVTLRHVRVTIFVVEKSCVRDFECVYVVLVIHHATRMRHTVIWGSLRLHLIFLRYLINGTIFVEELLIIKCVLIFSPTFIWKIFHLRRITWDIVVNAKTFSRKVSVIRVGF